MMGGGYMGMTQSEVVRYDGWWLYGDDGWCTYDEW